MTGFSDQFPDEAANAHRDETSLRKFNVRAGSGLPFAPGEGHFEQFIPDNGRFPSGAIPIVGCLQCDWKDKGLCPHGLVGDEVYKDGICYERKGFIFMHYDGKLKAPQTYELLTPYLQSQAHSLLQDDLRNLLSSQQRLRRLEEQDADVESIKAARGAYYAARSLWFSLHQDVMKNYQRYADRLTPKKTELTVERKVTPSDVTRLMREASVDVIEGTVKERDDDD